MSNYKRKKKKLRKDGWSSSGRLHKHKRKVLPSEEKSYPRKKIKKVVILAKSKPGKTFWWNPRKTHDWFVWSRYEKQKDAENALRTLTKSRWNEYYEFK